MQPTNRRAALCAAILLGIVATSNTTALGQMVATVETPPDPNERQVVLMRQDVSDCSNGNVSDSDPSLQRGIISVIRGSDGITRVKVGILASANTTYHFFLKCVRHLGDVRTYEEGEGGGVFEFPTNLVGNVYAFDMYPQGAPPGNKFQSVQVKY